MKIVSWIKFEINKKKLLSTSSFLTNFANELVQKEGEFGNETIFGGE